MKRCPRCNKSQQDGAVFGRSVYAKDGLRHICRDCDRADHKRRRQQFVAGRAPPVEAVKPATGPAQSNVLPPLLKQLVELTKRQPVSFSALCDKLDLSPLKLRALLAEATSRQVALNVEHDHIGFAPSKPVDTVQETNIAPVTSGIQRVAVISDIHFGSRYCLRPQLQDFVTKAYDLGVREILCPGDILDGNYVTHGLFELSHVGLDNQLEDFAKTLPKLPGLTYHAITGNHDMTFEQDNGVNVGRALMSARPDLRIYGNRGAFLKVKGATIHLWHPMGGGSYARSYKLQKRVEAYASGEKPHILLAGHWHIYCHLFERGVHAVACPTFQGGGSAFGKAIGGAPAIGGMILEWEMTADGTMRSFRHEYVAYFEREVPQQVA